MASPSTRPWLGVGVALSALPAAGGAFCAALLLALIADSDPGGVYEQHRWLDAVVAAGTVCAFAAMMGWATLRHGGVPAPVLLMALVVAAVPFALPGGLFLPGVAAAFAACAALAAAGLARPPASPRLLRHLTVGLALTAVVLAIGQAIVVALHDRPAPAPAAGHAAPHTVITEPAPLAAPRRPDPEPEAAMPSEATPKAAPRPSAPHSTAPHATAPPATAPAAPRTTAGPATPERFVRAYYAALDARRFATAWKLLAPGLQARFGGFAAWRSGYKYTVANSPAALRVTPAGGAATVGLTLRARDRDACGKTVARRFAVTWRLARTEAGWRATAAGARAISSRAPESAATC